MSVKTTALVALLFPQPTGAASHSVLPPGDPGHATFKATPTSTMSTTVSDALVKAAAGDTVTLRRAESQADQPARYIEDITITKANVQLGSDFGVIFDGTIRVDAPGVTIRFLTLIADESTVILGPGARDCRIYLCKIVTRKETGIALDVAGPDAGNLQLYNCTIYTRGGKDPQIEHRGFPYNWKPMPRAQVGVRIQGRPGNDGAYIHHTRIAGYENGVWIGDEEKATLALNAHLWKNQITANTTGIRIFAGGCLVEDNQVMRNTSTGVIAHGSGNQLLRNQVFDSADWGMQIGGARAVNNVLAGNRGGGLRLLGASQVIHNTLYGNGGVAVSIGHDAQTSSELVNNLVDHEGAIFESETGFRRHHNVYVNHSIPESLGEGSRHGLTAFADLARRNYRPSAESIAVDAATMMPDVVRDVSNSGRTIGEHADAGAYEVGPPGATGRQWWVGPDGNDDVGTGAADQPFKTVARAARDAGPDDRIYLQPGDYEQSIDITCAGAPGHPVRIGPAPGIPYARDLVTSFVPKDPVEIAPAEDGKVVVHKSVWTLENATNVHVEGIEFRDTPHGVIRLGNRASHNAIRRCVFLNCPTNPNTASYGAGIISAGLEANDILIEDNIFDARWAVNNHRRETDVINPGEGNWCKRWVFRRNKVAGYQKLQLGIGLPTGYVPTYHLVEDNEFFNCNEGVHIKTSDNIFRGNYIHHMSSGYLRLPVGMVNRAGFRNIYEGNRVEDCSYAGMVVFAADNVVRNNVFDRCDTGVIVAYREFGAEPAKYTRVAHNTIVDCNRAVHVDPRCSATVYNNVIYRSPQRFKDPAIVPAVVADNSGIYPPEKSDWTLFGRLRYWQTALLRADFNVYFNAEPAYLRNFEGGHYDVYGDPMFVDVANGDYRLQPQSPARGAGRSLDIGHDFHGRSRPRDHPDCGAFQGE